MIELAGFEALTVESFRALQRENEALRAKNRELEDRISAVEKGENEELKAKNRELEDRISALEKMLLK
jgi:hypothetical protein